MRNFSVAGNAYEGKLFEFRRFRQLGPTVALTGAISTLFAGFQTICIGLRLGETLTNEHPAALTAIIILTVGLGCSMLPGFETVLGLCPLIAFDASHFGPSIDRTRILAETSLTVRREKHGNRKQRGP